MVPSVQVGDDRHTLNILASPSWIPAFAGMTVGARNDGGAHGVTMAYTDNGTPRNINPDSN